MVSTELLVVVALLSILTAVAVPAVGRVSSTARRSVLAATVRELQIAVDAYYMNAGTLPRLPGVCSWAIIDFDAHDQDSRTFAPDYIKWRPDASAGIYGLRADAPVFFGVTPLGRVFVTQQPPDAPYGWSEVPDEVQVSGNDTPEPVDSGPLTEVVRIAAVVSQPSTVTGSTVTVTATAYSESGSGVSGVPLRFAIQGSVSGERALFAVTDADGNASVQVGTDHAEVVCVTVSSE